MQQRVLKENIDRSERAKTDEKQATEYKLFVAFVAVTPPPLVLPDYSIWMEFNYVKLDLCTETHGITIPVAALMLSEMFLLILSQTYLFSGNLCDD